MRRSGAAQVAVEIPAVERAQGRVAHDEAADHRAAGLRRVALVRIGEERRHLADAGRARIRDRGGVEVPFALAPAQVRPAQAVLARRPVGQPAETHLLPRVLADIGDDEITGEPVEGGAKRVAEPIREDLGTWLRPVRRPAARVAGERVGRGDPVRRAVGLGARVDAEHLAQQRVRVLALLRRVAAVAEGGVKVAVGTELELAAVVVVGMVVVLAQHDTRRARLGPVGVAGGDPVLDDLQLAVVGAGDLEDVEQAAGRVIGRERHREEAALPVDGDVGHGEERRHRRAVSHVDLAVALDNEQPAVARWSGGVDGSGREGPVQRDKRLPERSRGEGGERDDREHHCERQPTSHGPTYALWKTNGSASAISASRGAVRSRSETVSSMPGQAMPTSGSSYAMPASVAGS